MGGGSLAQTVLQQSGFRTMPFEWSFQGRDFGRIPPIPGGTTVLLVEDSPHDVMLFQTALSENGVQPQLFVASDGEEAFLLLEEIDQTVIPCPDLIALDLDLPKKTGFEVLKRVRESKKCEDKPVVILSTTDGVAERSEAQRLGATTYFVKPFNVNDLLKIGKHLRTLLLGEPG
jgi:two-component system, chemotaxis family, response regulator Rcp1